MNNGYGTQGQNSIGNEKKAHRIQCEARASMRLCGICDVKSFDPKSVLLTSTEGDMVIEGEDLRITVWNTEAGNMELTGRIDGLYYYESHPNDQGNKNGKSGKNGGRESGWHRLFR